MTTKSILTIQFAAQLINDNLGFVIAKIDGNHEFNEVDGISVKFLIGAINQMGIPDCKIGAVNDDGMWLDSWDTNALATWAGKSIKIAYIEKHEVDEEGELVCVDWSSDLLPNTEDYTDRATLGGIDSDKTTGAAWRNGRVIAPNGETIPMGGGWIENGEYVPYARGEDESGWEEKIMPFFLGKDWDDHPLADEWTNMIFADIQSTLANLA